MAIDSVQKRMSAMNPACPWRGPMIDAPETGFDVGARQAADFHYSGIESTSGVDTSPAPLVITFAAIGEALVLPGGLVQPNPLVIAAPIVSHTTALVTAAQTPLALTAAVPSVVVTADPTPAPLVITATPLPPTATALVYPSVTPPVLVVAITVASQEPTVDPAPGGQPAQTLTFTALNPSATALDWFNNLLLPITTSVVVPASVMPLAIANPVVITATVVTPPTSLDYAEASGLTITASVPAVTQTGSPTAAEPIAITFTVLGAGSYTSDVNKTTTPVVLSASLSPQSESLAHAVPVLSATATVVAQEPTVDPFPVNVITAMAIAGFSTSLEAFPSPLSLAVSQPAQSEAISESAAALAITISLVAPVTLIDIAPDPQIIAIIQPDSVTAGPPGLGEVIVIPKVLVHSLGARRATVEPLAPAGACVASFGGSLVAVRNSGR